MHRSTRFFAVAIAMGICAPGAQAQFGGLKNKLKKKVEAAAGVNGGDSAGRGDARAGDDAASATRRAGPRFDDRILEMTPEVLDRFAASLQAERTGRASAAAALSPAARQKWQACEQQVITSKEMQALLDKFSAANDREDTAAAQKVAAEMTALRDRKCGIDPTTGTYRDSVTRAANAATLEAGKFTPEQYSLLKERVVPFCKRTAEEVDGGARVAGSGQDIYYVYSQREVEALRPRCGALSSAIAATM